MFPEMSPKRWQGAKTLGKMKGEKRLGSCWVCTLNLAPRWVLITLQDGLGSLDGETEARSGGENDGDSQAPKDTFGPYCARTLRQVPTLCPTVLRKPQTSPHTHSQMGLRCTGQSGFSPGSQGSWKSTICVKGSPAHAATWSLRALSQAWRRGEAALSWFSRLRVGKETRASPRRAHTQGRWERHPPGHAVSCGGGSRLSIQPALGRRESLPAGEHEPLLCLLPGLSIPVYPEELWAPWPSA